MVYLANLCLQWVREPQANSVERYLFKQITLGSSFHAQPGVSGTMAPMYLAKRKRVHWSEMLGQLESCISQSSIDLHINNLVSQKACLLGSNVLICQIKQSNLLDSCSSQWKLTNWQVHKFYIYEYMNICISISRSMTNVTLPQEMSILRGPSISGAWNCKVKH